MANLVSITISPDEFTAAKGTTIQYFAYGKYDDDTIVDITNSVEWSSDDDEVATVNNTDKKGEVYCNIEGSTAIVAYYSDTIYTKSDITVTATIFKEWNVTPNMLCTIVQGSGSPIIVKAMYIDGSSVDVLPTSVSSSDENIATISISNLLAFVTGVNPGQCILTLNVTSPTGEQASLQEYCIVLPLVTEQIVEKNYITNGQFKAFNDYITPDSGMHDVSSATKDNPFYINGYSNQDTGTNTVPNFGKIMFYKTGSSINGNDYILINTIAIQGLPTGTAQYAMVHYCPIYTVQGQAPSSRMHEFCCASITEFNNEDVKIKLKVANIGTTVANINIFYRQYYSANEDNYVDAALTWTVQPTQDPENPEINSFEDIIHIAAVDNTKITPDSFFSLVYNITTEGDSFGLGFTGVSLVNTVNKINPTIDELNSFDKSNKLPDLKSLDIINDANKVLRTFINTKAMANGITYSYLDNIYEDMYDIGDIVFHDGGDGVTQSLVHKGWLFAYGTTISTSRFRNLFDYWGGAKYGYGAETITAEYVVDPFTGAATVVLINKDLPFAGVSQAIGYSGFTFTNDSAGIPGYSTTSIVFTGDGNSLYNDAVNNACYIKFFSKYTQWNAVLIIDGKLYCHQDVDINSVNTVLVKISKTYDSTAVLEAIADAFNPLAFALPNWGGYVPRGIDYRTSGLIDPDVANRTINGVTVGAVPGSIQATALMTHTHAYNNVTVKYDAGGAGTNFAMQHVTVDMPSQTSCSNLFSGSLGNSGTSTECRMPNFGGNYKIRF
ncbi:hypothetical protein HGB13_00310 [bacterium]|nr:hypothetical protein [bacterium]